MQDILEELNDEQIKPVRDTEGAVLVLAGAGSGKTRVLTSRIAYILSRNKASLSEILAITFTNKAAAEMKERLQSVLGMQFSYGEGKWICTIHSMCVKILRQFAENAGIQPNFSIYSDTERNNVIKRVFRELDLTDEKVLKNAKFHIGNAKMLGLDADIYLKRHAHERGIEDCMRIYEGYQKHLRDNNALDFDDLLLETLRLLKRDKEVCDYLSDKFKYILVDEFQDTNAVQFGIIKLLSKKHGNIFAVGDDDQSIYGWRGAEIENILSFDKAFPKAKVYKLERNYRSTNNILKLANRIISKNTERRGKKLWTDECEGEKPQYYQADEESGEALFTAREISSAAGRGAKYSDFAVLMRINALTRSYEQEFTKYGIPYKVFGGFKFFERKEIKDMLAYFRLISNPFDDEALERVINVPRRGIGDKTIEQMRIYAATNGLSLFDAAVDCEYMQLSRSAKDKLKDFVSIIKNLIIEAQGETVAQLARGVLTATDLRSAFDDGSDEGDSKLANIDEFVASVDDFCRLNPEAKLDEYLSQITLFSDTDEMDGGDYVTLATIHSVKGLEFNTVFICGLEDGIMPTSRAENEGNIEEERRLMYVAITRAKRKLYLTRSRSRYIYGRRDITKPSRFINELAPELGIPAKTRSTFGENGYQERRSESYGERYNNNYESRKTDYGNSGFGGGYARTNATFRPSWNSGLPPRADSNATAAGGKYSVGMHVRHPKFGNGTIVAIKNGGATINVAFDGQGIKELAASLAPLQII